MAGLGDMVNKAKEWAGQNPDKADGFVDKGSDAVKGKFAGHDEQVDQASQKAKDFLHGPQGEQAPPPPPQGEQPPPPPQQ
ncbi:antitoxin [Actinomycetospora termitidis]|uniref:Antitoxin n=1 Tax=Actinomycetospora termitidis TaxID=3053470 RepID=A0ABT7MBR9_9PSEU|nr:antitoxin [Actinomycetospora sp. Odt1-22]MDL5157452.1 antitoxin [Actinomycetospora sp. Odt1-22]